MKNWKIWTAFLTVFVSGILVGVVGFGFVLKHKLRPPKAPAEFHQMMRARMLDDIITEVKPDKAALPQIEIIIDDTLRKLLTIRRETGPRVKAVLEQGKESIKSHLTPEQAARLDEMVEKRRKGRFGLFHFPPPPPPHLD